MKNETLRLGAGSLLPSAAPVKQNPRKSPRVPRQPLPAAIHSTPEPNPRDLPPGVMLGALVLDSLYKKALGYSFYSACSLLEGVWELTQHHPDLCAYNDALAGIVTGEKTFCQFYSSLGRSDGDIETALEEPLTNAAELLGVCLRRLVNEGAASPVHLEAHARLVAGLGTLERLRSYLDAL